MTASVYNNIDGEVLCRSSDGQRATSHLFPENKTTAHMAASQDWDRPVFKLSQENGVAGVDPGERHSAPDSPSLSQAYEGVSNF